MTERIGLMFEGVFVISKILNAFLIITVDVHRGSSRCKQILITWDLVENNDFERAIKNVENNLLLYTDEYIKRCKERDDAGGMTCPLEWAKDESFVWFKKKEENVMLEGTEVLLPKLYDLDDKLVNFLWRDHKGFASQALPLSLSNDEKKIVECKHNLLIMGRSGTGKTTAMLYRLLYYEIWSQTVLSKLNEYEDKFEEKKGHQLLITVNPMLCKSVKEEYSALLKTMMNIEQIQLPNPSESKLELRDFISCEDDAFPVITTYDNFLNLINQSLSFPFPKNPLVKVDYNIFQFGFFPRVDTSLNISCALLYTEIMAFIKGSVQSIMSDNGYIKVEDYLKIANQRSSIFDVSKRLCIYKEFRKYQFWKNTKNFEDTADRVFIIYKAVKREVESGIYKGRQVDFIYVDEVQDLSPAQLYLLRYISTNSTQFIFAGDTAQTVCHGCSFRFEKLKDLFYNEFGFKKNFEQLSLLQNFRTHRGIGNVSSILIDMMVRFFPNFIGDKEKENFERCGPQPVFLLDKTDILEELFSKESLVSFGSEQAILVRDEAMKEKVRAISNEEVLVLTVSEAKGLEFDDCLVYNFLSSCQEKGLWRQIYNFRDLGVRPPKFYMDSHASLFRELSMFYVLVTRAKEKLVIFEEREEARQPMIALLQHEKLVSTQRFSSNIVSLFIKSSSNETWTKKGELFLEKKQFSNAFICFTKANNKELATRCNAMSLEFRADTSDLSLYEEKKCYMDAGSLFSSLKNKYYEDAARCYSKGRCYQKAANFYEVCQKWAEAAECLEHMKNFNSAFELYIKAEEVQRAIQCLVKGASFEFGVTFLEEAIQKNKDKSLYCTKLIEAKNESIQKGAVYHRNRNNKDSMMYFVRLFPNLEQMKKFLSKSYPKELLLLEKENDNDSESAETYLKLFAYEEAAACYLKANNYQEALSCHVRLLRSQICPFIAENKVIRFDGNTIETLEKANRTVKVEKNFQCQCLLKELKFYNSLLHIEQSLLDDIYKEVKNEVGAWYLKLYVAQHAINCCRDNWKKLSCYNTELQMVISKFIQSCVPKKRSAQALDNRNLEIFRDVVEYFGMQLSNSVISTCITISADMDSSLSKQFQKVNSVGTCDKLSSGLIKYFDYYTFCEVAEGLLRQLSLDVSYKVIECINNNLEDNKECFHELTDMLQILFEELMKVEPLISKEKLCELEGMKKKYCLELKNFLFPRFFPSGLDNAALVVELRQNEKMRAPLEYYITNYLSKSNFNENTLLTWLLQAELFDETFLRKQLFIIGDRLRNIYKTEELMFKIREIFLVRRSFPLDRLNYHYQESFYVLKNLLLMTLTRVDNHSTKFVSPHIFIKLLEKHCVFLLIQYTRVRNLLLTYSLASDWICRKNKRFTDVIRFMSKVNAVVYKTQELDYKNDAGNIESVYAYTGYRNSYEWKASVMRYDIERGNVAFNLKKQEKLEPILGEHLIKVLELLCLSLERLSLPYTNGEAKVQRWVRMTSLFSDKTNKKNVSSVIKKMINLYICILINIKEVNSNKYFADKWLQKLRFATYSEIFQSEFKEDRSFLYILEDLNIETIEDKFFSYLKTAGDTLITININRRPMTEEKSFRKAYYYIEMGEYPALTLKKEYLKNFSESFVNKSMEEVTKLNTVKTIENMVFTVLFLKVKYYAAKYRMTQLSRLQLSRRRTECELLKEKKIISRKTEGVKEYIQTVCRVIKKMESLIKKFQNLISTLKEGNFEFSLEEARTTVDNLSQNLSEILSCKSLTLQNSEELYERTNYVLNFLNTNTKQASKKLTKISSDCNVPIK